MPAVKPRVVILHTGGTLGMRPRAADQALAPDEFGPALAGNVPELAEIAEIDARVLCNIDSCDVTPAHWESFAREITAAVAEGRRTEQMINQAREMYRPQVRGGVGGRCALLTTRLLHAKTVCL